MIVEGAQAIRVDWAARWLIGKRYPGYTLVAIPRREESHRHRGDALYISAFEHSCRLGWWVDYDGHAVWLGVCPTCKQLFYWTEEGPCG